MRIFITTILFASMTTAVFAGEVKGPTPTPNGTPRYVCHDDPTCHPTKNNPQGVCLRICEIVK
jgi:hypothetical protein